MTSGVLKARRSRPSAVSLFGRGVSPDNGSSLFVKRDQKLLRRHHHKSVSTAPRTVPANYRDR